MIIYILDKTFEVKNDENKINEYLELIYSYLNENNWALAHLLIDNQPVYDDFLSYFKKYILEIKEVEVFVKPLEIIIKQTTTPTYDYIKNAIPLIRSMGEEFYEFPSNSTWSKLIDLFEGIQWIIGSVIQISEIMGHEKRFANYQIWNEYVLIGITLNGIILELDTIMINKDNVFTGDLLLYEIVPLFEKMLESLYFLVDQEGTGHVS